MAIDKLRLRVKTVDGYNAAHLETSADLVVGLTEAIDNEIDTQVPKDLNGFTNNAGYAKTSEVSTALAGKLTNTATGSATKGIYINSSGAPAAMTYSVNKDVPADAKFTDTTYTPASAAPNMDGVAAVGTSAKYAREDHVHPTDISRASAADVLALYKEAEATKELVSGLDSAAIYRMASGDLATFYDAADVNVRDLSVTLTPSRYFNGYERPWVGGTNVNLLKPPDSSTSVDNSYIRATSSSENRITLTINRELTSYQYVTVSPEHPFTVLPGDMLAFLARKMGTNGSYIGQETVTAYVDFHDSDGNTVVSMWGHVRIADAGSVSSNYIHTFSENEASRIVNMKCVLRVGPNVTNGYDGVYEFMLIRYTADMPTTYVSLNREVPWSPYANVCPISGANSVKIGRIGKNLVPCSNAFNSGENLNYTYTSDGVSFYDPPGGPITINKPSGSPSVRLYFTDPVTRMTSTGMWLYATGLERGKTYEFTFGGTPDGVRFEIAYYKNLTYTRSVLIIREDCQFTLRSANDYNAVCIYLLTESDVEYNNLTLRPMIREVGADPTYELPSVTSYNIPLSNAGPVYGGTFDVTTGVLTVTSNLAVLTGEEPFYTSSGSTEYKKIYCVTDATALNAMFPGMLRDTIWHLYYRDDLSVCSHFKHEIALTEQMDIGEYAINCNITDARLLSICVSPTIADSPEAFKAWLAAQYANGTPVQITYPLATPVTYQLTPQQLAALKGCNRIFSDAGTVEVTYRADPALTYANLESTITAAILSLGAGI